MMGSSRMRRWEGSIRRRCTTTELYGIDGLLPGTSLSQHHPELARGQRGFVSDFREIAVSSHQAIGRLSHRRGLDSART